MTMLQMPLQFMNRLDKTGSAIFVFLFVYFLLSMDSVEFIYFSYSLVNA